MAEYPALPLFTDAYMADTRHLTAAQHGAYLLLMMTAWRMPDCKLPDDDRFLSRCAAMDMRTWKANRTIIMAFWNLDLEKKWCQHRLLDERKYVGDKRRKNSAAGKASALKRLNRGSTNVQPESNQNLTPTPTPIIEELEKESNSSTPTSPPKRKAETDSEGFAEFWTRWIPYDMTKGSKQDAAKAYAKARKEIDHDSLIRASAQYFANCQAVRSKTKHVASWLNGRGWESDDATGQIAARGGHDGYVAGGANRRATALELALADRTHRGGADILEGIAAGSHNAD